MCGERKGLLITLTIFVLFLMCCVFAGESSQSLDQELEDEALDTQREFREYDQESWHVVHNTPEGASGWIPRDPIDNRPGGVVYTKRRRLRKRKRRPPVLSYAYPGPEYESKPTEKFQEAEPHKKETGLENAIKPTNDGFKNDHFTKPKRRKRPNVREPLEEMQEESGKSYVRRKIIPAYQPSEELGIITSSNSNLSALGAIIQFNSEEKTSSENTPKHAIEHYEKPKTTKNTHSVERNSLDSITNKTPNLKAILKQTGGLSLSEILQQKNLTLSQLLMGNQEAIKALTKSPEEVPSSTVRWQNDFPENVISSTQKSTSSSDNLEATKYKRLPPSAVLKKENINRKYEHYGESHESLTDRELMEAQRKRFALLQEHSYKNAQNGMFSEVTRYEVMTEPTTEKRIFVPSHPKLYTSIDYRPEFTKLAETRTESYKSKPETSTTHELITQTTTASPTQGNQSTTQPTKVTKASILKSKLDLPITSAKLNKIAIKNVLPTKQTITLEEENYPITFKPLKIDIKDVLGFLENQPGEKVSDGPFRMSIDLETISEKTTRQSLTDPSSTKLTFASTPRSSLSIATASSSPDIPISKPFSAKDEIEEILKDPEGKEKLAKILEARNMTIDELIDQRERGSSQLHLADIFHNKTKEPEPAEEAFEGRVGSEVFTDFPVFIRQPKALLEPEGTTQKQTDESSRRNNILVTAFPSFKIEVPKELPKDFDKSTSTFPWKQIYPDLFNIQDKNKETSVILPAVISNGIDSIQNRDISAKILKEENIQRLEDLDQRLLSSVSSEDLNVVDEKIHKIIKIPSGVQSAIVASLVIVGLSLIVFMTILVVFRWTQRRKTKIKYCDSLKPPLFDVKPKNIKTFVTKTLDKSKINYYKNNLQSMSDNVWEKESERKASF